MNNALKIPFTCKASVTVRFDLIAIFLIAFTIRAILLTLSISQIGCDGIMDSTPDGILYVNMAGDILSGTDNYEHGFLTFGPGFAYCLAIFWGIFGKGLFPFILFQVFVSSLSCLLIYWLAILLTRSHSVAILAGLFAVLSHTSILLSIVLLSDTLYFFLFLFSLILLIIGLEKNRRRYFAASGFLMGIAILFRSLGQFWPLMIILIILLFPKEQTSSGVIEKSARRKLLLQSLTAVAISVFIVSLWVMRNFIIHDIPVVTSASANGSAKLVGVVIENIYDRPPAEIWHGWEKEYMDNHEVNQMTLKDSYLFYHSMAFATLSNHPWQTIKAYFHLLWENLNDIDYIHRSLYPKYKAKTIRWEYLIKNLKLNYLSFVFSIIGTVMLLVKRHYRALIVLVAVYFYYMLLLGFGRWQGSRLFYPGEIASSILASFAICSITSFLWAQLFRREILSD